MMSLTINYDTFITLLLEAVSELSIVYAEHIDDYDELIEHVFIGEVTRFSERLYAGDPNSVVLKRLLDFIGCAFAADDEKLKELISVSFLENLSRDGDSFEGIRVLLSAKLSEELSKYD
ncbi:DUF7674 family protein [Rheinheimera baltica]|uniref:DUF7674 family protein n=1 Tax=Rheinheimera baltica TaxID=67576 RepID=UPI00041F3868|nr:hypothetical protein [Rheinheimera baltica]